MSALNSLIVSAAALSLAVGMRVTGVARHLLRAAFADPSPTAVWPVSIAGWFALVAAIVACIGVFIGWGKYLASLDGIKKELHVMSSKVGAIGLTADSISDEVTIIRHTLWGPKGDNGMASDVREMVERVEAIEKRNNIIDAMTERERGAREHGDERRNTHRRREDRVVLGEEDINR